jgi:hypothetical protein
MKKILVSTLFILGLIAFVFAFSIPSEEPLSAVTGYEENPNLKLVPLENRIYHAMSPDIFTGWSSWTNPKIIEETVSYVEKDLAWVSVSNTWFPRGGKTDCRQSMFHPFDPGIHFPKGDVETALRAGYTPSIRMLPYDRCISDDYEGYKLQTFIDGKHDEKLRAWARDAKEVPSPLLVTFGVEVNGEWFPWNMRHNGDMEKREYGDPSEYDGHERFRDAYRHIVDIFREENVQNVTWFYHVNCVWPTDVDNPVSSVDAYYPGDDYIDWIAMSCYGSQDARNPFWWDMSYTFDRSYKLLEDSEIIGKDKPIALMEFGVTEDPRKPQWIETFFDDLVSGKYPRLRAVAWWQSQFCIEYGERTCDALADIHIESSPESLETYKRYISNPLFVSTPRFQ